ncbi:hypothetical protein [Pasteuria penetrans]|nr:hypothetical protein [Pasteuria penetrans]
MDQATLDRNPDRTQQGGGTEEERNIRRVLNGQNPMELVRVT